QDYIVRLNGQVATRFRRSATDTVRGNPPGVDPNSGFIGLQTHTGNVAFANVRIKTYDCSVQLRPGGFPRPPSAPGDRSVQLLMFTQTCTCGFPRKNQSMFWLSNCHTSHTLSLPRSRLR